MSCGEQLTGGLLRKRCLRVCLALLASSSLAGAQLPPNHPRLPQTSTARAVNDSSAQAVSQPGLRPVPLRNFIDQYIFGKMRRDGIPNAGLAPDAEFLRRVYLDLTGRLPEPEEIKKFLADPHPDKRDKLIDSLMATPINGQIDKPETPFLDRWTYFFCDLFRVSFGELDRGRNLFRDYLYLMFLANIPYDEMVREMLTASARSQWLDGPANFLARDHVDDFKDILINDEDTDDEIAITSAKVFLGINLECVSCHNGQDHLHKINLWLSHVEREQLWRQAAFFSKLKISRSYSIGQEMAVLHDGNNHYDVTRPSVRFMPRHKADLTPQFLLTGEGPRPGEDWRCAFARLLTTHPQFARATVNLIWAELMGVGIVDPPFAFDLDRQDPSHPPPPPWTIQPTHPELLNALAKDFQEHHYDLRYLIGLIAKSSTYQLSSNFEGKWKDSYTPYFARHIVHRLPAEMIVDAISQATGLFQPIPIKGTDKKVDYVLHTYSPEDISGKELEPMHQLLELLGQGRRDSVERNLAGSVLQASALLNSKFLKDHIQVQFGGRLYKLLNHEPPLSNKEIVDEVFLAFLARYPRPKESGIAMKTLEERHGQGLEDLAWTMINKPEFVLDY